MFSQLAVTRGKVSAAVFALTALSVVTPHLQPEAKVAASATIGLELIGRANSGVGNAGSEIAAFDKDSKRLFVTNGATNKVDIFDIANPSAPVKLGSTDLASAGATGIQSVASKNGKVAVAASVGGNNQAPGRIFLMSTSGVIDSRAPQGIEVGSLPDSVHFSPDGKYVLSANEGEPRDYCLTDGALPTSTDPFGSVSIIDITASTLTATTLDFSAMNSRASEIRTAGGRIYGPGASVAQDIEPEYIAISADSKKAFVTLQENNSVVEIDIVNKKITRLMGLGYKDHSIAGNGLDPSDQDSASNSGINISTWNVKGMYQPDAIATFTDAAGNHYFATANEGDAREY
jgi:DNA-binding beta-propeller fold protein YncE